MIPLSNVSYLKKEKVRFGILPATASISYVFILKWEILIGGIPGELSCINNYHTNHALIFPLSYFYFPVLQDTQFFKILYITFRWLRLLIKQLSHLNK